MNIRPAVPADRPAIIALLKESLGESTIPKSERLWVWKHEENPFGASYVLVAEEGGIIIGLRAFMKWEWVWKDRTYTAIRAVDTATHPAHQGKGIFKKLTLAQLDICKRDGVDFVFNTPNQQSLPGYLKMGWVQQGKMPLKIKVLKPLALVYKRFLPIRKARTADNALPAQAWDQHIKDLLKKASLNAGHLTTNISAEYLLWRYANNPLFTYNFFTDSTDYLLVSRIKDQAVSKELRIVDFILLNGESNASAITSRIKKEISGFCKKNSVDFISVSGRQYNLNKGFFSWMGLLPVKPLGPVITLRDLNSGNNFNDLLEVDNWNYRLGDFELF